MPSGGREDRRPLKTRRRPAHSAPGGGFGGAAGGSTPPATTAPGSTTPGSANDSMVVLKIDSDKLPKAPDLKAYLFPSTLCVVVSDQDVKVVSRGAFPNLSAPTNVAPIAGAIPGLSSLIDRLKPAQAGAASPAPGAGSPPGDAAAPKAATGSPAPGLLGGRRGGGRPAPR